MRFTKNGVMPSDSHGHDPLPLPPEPLAPLPESPRRRWRFSGLLGPSPQHTVFQCIWMGGVWLLFGWVVWHYLPVLTGWAWGDWGDVSVARRIQVASILLLMTAVLGAISHAFWLLVAVLRRVGLAA